MRELACVFVLLLACIVPRAGAMEKEEFLEVLTALQEKVKDVEVIVHAKEYRIDRETMEVKETPYSRATRFLMAGQPGGKIRFERDSIGEWHVDGKLMDEPARMIESCAFNGKIGTYVRYRPGTDGEKGPALNQHILPDRPGKKYRSMAYACGSNLVAAYYRDVGLAQSLADWGDWDLIPVGADTYTVRFGDKRSPELGKSLEVTVDLARGGAITRTKNSLAQEPLYHGCRNVVLEEVSEGIWLPVSADSQMYYYLWKLTFEKVAVNQDIPESEFVIEFEAGQQVWDKIHDVKFIAGPTDDAALKAGVRSGLADLDSLMPPEAATDGPQPAAAADAVPLDDAPSADAGWSRWWVVVSGCIAAAVAALVFYLRTRRRGAGNA